jgi:hypothetical protein
VVLTLILQRITLIIFIPLTINNFRNRVRITIRVECYYYDRRLF